jgi:hypothetical protein
MPSKNPVRLPDDTQRLSIVGRTGSGKTVAAVWHFSNANWDRMPWIVYDFKRDSLLSEIGELDGAFHIDTGELPSRPGIYLVHPHPHETEAVQEQMWRIWQQENTGVFVDEGYMVCGPANSNSAFRSLLTQGRSKHIPMIILSQRPVWMDRFVFSESDFYQVFALNHSGDRKKIQEYIPTPGDQPLAPLPEYHSYYHDVAKARTVVLGPVPTSDAILKVYTARLDAMKDHRRRVVI